MFQSPFDQPGYGKAKKKKKKKAKTKAPARKKKIKKAAKKSPTRKKARATASPKDFDTPKEWQGVPKDLRGLVKLLNDLYFSKLAAFGRKPVVIEDLKWGQVAVTRNGTCRYFRDGPKNGQVRIIINGQLRPASVPTMVTAFTLYHEMVHAYCFKTGNTACSGHNREFRKRERLFKGWREVAAWRDRGGLFSDGECCHPFKVGQKVSITGRGNYTVTGGTKGWIFLTRTRGGSYRARRHHLVASNPGYGPVLPELEGDAEVVVWGNPGMGSVLPELDDDLEIMEWEDTGGKW